ncbi:MAG: hypothetical protein Kow0026_15100 [Oricola sp.]
MFRTIAIVLAAQLLLAGPVTALTREELKESIALLINMKGYLCASVQSVTPLALENTYEVECTEYRGGRGKVRYIFGIRANGIHVEKP